MFKQVDLLGEPYIYSIVSMYLLYQNMMIYAYIMINWNLWTNKRLYESSQPSLAIPETQKKQAPSGSQSFWL